jgi:hypothetical protein
MTKFIVALIMIIYIEIDLFEIYTPKDTRWKVKLEK